LAKHLKLQYSETASVFIAGIVASCNHLKLSWALNQTLGWQLAVMENMVVTNNKTGTTSEFTFFQYENDASLLRYSLVANKIDNAFFFEELKNIDYLLIVKGGLENTETETIIQKLRSIPEISTFLTIQPENLKRKERLGLF
jgi:hypothetical protein